MHRRPARPPRIPHLRLSIAALGLVTATACSGLTDADLDRLAPKVSALQNAVFPGAALGLRLENASAFAWQYRACPSRFERLEFGEWVDIGAPLVACTALHTMIGADETIEIQASFPVGVTHGTYRAVVGFEADGHSVDRASNSFTVPEPTLEDGERPLIQAMVPAIASGTALPIRLTNFADVQFGFNLCSGGRLERRDGDNWVDIGEPLWLCTEELRLLAPRSSEDTSFSILPDVAAGEYRLRVKFYGPTGAWVISHSNSFAVE